MAFFNALAGIFSLLLVVGLGFLLGKLGWFAPDSRKLLPRLVTNISLPPFLACTIISSFSRATLLPMLYGALLPLLAMALLYIIAYIGAKLLRVPKRRFGIFCACVSNPNTIFIGIPVNLALFGAASTPYVLLYYFPSTFFFWTVGNYFISRDESPVARKGSAFQWQKIFAPPMYGFACGLACICLDLHPPEFLFQAAKITGELTTPLALIFIGLTLEALPPAKIRLNRDIALPLLGRLILSPALLWLLLPFFGLPKLMGDVFIIQSSLPVLMQVAILSAYYDTDPEYGSIMVCLSTILCAFTVPIYMALL